MRMLSPWMSEWSRRSLSPDVAMGDVFDEFDRVVNSFLRPTYAATVNFQPSCDIKETKDHYLVSFDMPGVKKEDIKIEVQNNQLVISGERQYEMKEEEGESTLRHERAYGKFERTFTLPTTVNTDKIEAHYENGVLNVALPKAEAAKGRTIQIQSGQNSIFSKLLGSKKEGTKELKDVKVS
ncbi:MAG: Hsp20/alpha crystallin family protein [Bdellovibrio sp.]